MSPLQFVSEVIRKVVPLRPKARQDRQAGQTRRQPTVQERWEQQRVDSILARHGG